jgi:EmrB/QacA subfamily drug resistance transporter
MSGLREGQKTRTLTEPNKWLILVAMTGAMSMVLLDQTVLTTALPTMTRELPLNPSGQQWVVNSYALAMAALVAFGGRLGDALGRVGAFRLGVIVFFLASVACGLTPSGPNGQYLMIGARAIQGVGAAFMVPVSAAIVIAAFPPLERGRAIAIYAGISQIFLAAGPLLGGVLTEYVSWRAAFWINVPVGLAALVLVRVARPPNPKSPTRLSMRDLFLMASGIGITVFAVEQSSEWGWGSAKTLGSLALGLALTTTFVLIQLRVTDPLINVRLFASRPFLGDTVSMGLVSMAMLGIVLFSTLYGQDLLNFSPVIGGLSRLPLIIAIAITAQIGGRWYDRSGVRAPTITGAAIGLLGVIMWALAMPHLTYWWQVPGMIVTGFGVGLTSSPTNTDSIVRVTPADRGQASGIGGTVRQLGGTLGLAIVGAVVLGIDPGGTTAAHGHPGSLQHAANAVTAGFVVSIGAFALAVIAACWLLAHDHPQHD